MAHALDDARRATLRARALAAHEAIGRLVGASIVTLPAIWVCVGIALVFVGLLPRHTGLVWAVLIGFLLLGEFGAIFGLPDWVQSLSPFGHVPGLPAADLVMTPLVTLTAIAAGLVAVGAGALRRRDFPTP